MRETTESFGINAVRDSAGSRTTLSRQSMADEIHRRLLASADELARQWRENAPINYFVLDDVLPEVWAAAIQAAFPAAESMSLKRSLRELKYVGAQMDSY